MATDKKKKTESKIVLEREYIVPLRKGWLKVPKYKRGKKAVKTLKEFMIKHMKIYDNDLNLIKLDVDLNNEIRFRGIRKPPAKIRVKAVKFDDEIVRVELIDVPEKLKFKRAREGKKKESKKAVKKEEKVEEKKDESKEEGTEKKEGEGKEEDKKDVKEKVKKEKVKEVKTKGVSKDAGVKIQRKALSR